MTPLVRLLPAFDEYTVAYQDRSVLVATLRTRDKGFGMLNPVVVVDGRVLGRWNRTIDKDSVHIRTTLHRALDGAGKTALRVEQERFAAFLDRDAKVSG